MVRATYQGSTVNTVMSKMCPKCGAFHGKEGMFCSRRCANSRVWTEQDKLNKTQAANCSQKVKEAAARRRGRPTGETISRISKICKNCGREFKVTPAFGYRQYCTAKCYHKVSGGYKKGSARSYSGYYKGVYCDSTYELCWVIYNLDHNIPFKRFEGFLEQNGTRYFPDFIIGNTIYELKNYRTDLVDRKTAIARNCGYEIFVLYKEDIQYMFDYVERTYNTKRYRSLYDSYEPHECKCSFCGKTFIRDSKIKTQVVYCCRRCAGKAVARRRTA